MTTSWPPLPPPVLPSYTPVNARTSLGKQPAAQASTFPNKSSVTSSMGWPQPVREYVSRAFMSTNEVAGISNADITVKLKDIITEAAENQRMDVINWSTHPLPQQILLLERSGAVPPLPPGGPFVPIPLHSVTTALGKRKTPEAEEQTSTSTPWKQGKSKNGSDKKQKRGLEMRVMNGSSKYNDLEARKQRFGLSNAGSPFSRDESPVPTALDGPVIGTCQNLEKSYFRLTAPPKAETVRPLPILKQSLDLLIQKWKQEHNYTYICDQFKSMRQDLTVQHIKNEFTVRVYEAHARIALEKGDLGEYNQCQTQLRALYRLNLGGRPGEFTAYRILYNVYTCNRTGMSDLLADLTNADRQHDAVMHALNVRSSLARGNYHKFFQLYEDPPNMGGYLMDMFVERERLAAMAKICKAYKPDVKVDFLSRALAFNDEQLCAQFLCDHNGEALFESRDDGVRFLTGKAGAIFETARQQAFAFVDIKGQI